VDEAARNLIVTRWRATLRAVARLGGQADALILEPRARADEVLALERSLGVRLPTSLRDTLLSFSRRAVFSWYLPDSFTVSEELAQIFRGGCRWSIAWIQQCNEAKNDWIRDVFRDPGDAYAAVWHDKLAFHEVGNGDYLAIDVAPQSAPSVVYLSHDDGEGHGRQLGSDFQDFLLRWSQLGCVGAEDWQWLPFAPDGGGLDPDCAPARLFRRRLGLSV